MNYNYVEVVQNLEELMFEADNDFIENYGISFQYITNGYVDSINYCGIEIFNSESPDLDDLYKEDKDEYISQQEFQDYIIKKTKSIIKRIYIALNKVEGSENTYDDFPVLLDKEYEKINQAYIEEGAI